MPLDKSLIAEAMKPGSPLYVLARTAHGEARGDPASQTSVMHSLLNRLKSGYRGAKSLQDLIDQPKQYSAWNPNDPNREQMLNITPEDPAFARIVALAQQVLAGSVKDPTGGAELYHTESITPNWDFSKLEPAGQFGQHVFYRKRTSRKTPAGAK